MPAPATPGVGPTRPLDAGELARLVGHAIERLPGDRYRIVDVAGEVRTNVIGAVERMTGLEVVEVNIAVDDVHLPDEEGESEPDEGRVR